MSDRIKALHQAVNSYLGDCVPELIGNQRLERNFEKLNKSVSRLDSFHAWPTKAEQALALGNLSMVYEILTEQFEKGAAPTQYREANGLHWDDVFKRSLYLFNDKAARSADKAYGAMPHYDALSPILAKLRTLYVELKTVPVKTRTDKEQDRLTAFKQAVTNGKTKLVGNCQCCGKRQAATNGTIAAHGYTIDRNTDFDIGSFSGTCLGAGYAPIQHSTDYSKEVIKSLHTAIDAAKGRIESLKNGTLFPIAFKGRQFAELHEREKAQVIELAINSENRIVGHHTASIKTLSELIEKCYGTELLVFPADCSSYDDYYKAK